MENHNLYKKFLELREKFSVDQLVLVFTRRKTLAMEYIRQGMEGNISDDIFETAQRLAMEVD